MFGRFVITEFPYHQAGVGAGDGARCRGEGVIGNVRMCMNHVKKHIRMRIRMRIRVSARVQNNMLHRTINIHMHKDTDVDIGIDRGIDLEIVFVINLT